MFGIDWIQYRALALTLLRMNLRGSSAGMVRRSGASGVGALVGMFVFHGLVGLAFAGLAYWADDVLLSGALLLTYVSFAILLAVLVDYNSVVTSPDDYEVLGFRPVAPRTYLAARLTNLLVFTTVVSIAISAAPAVAYGMRGPLLAVAVVVATIGTAFTTALAAVLFYAWLVVRVGTARLVRVLGYVQLALSIGVYGSFAVVPRLIQRDSAIAFRLPRAAWLHLHPAIWFARYLELANGEIGAAQIVPALATVALMAGLVRIFAGRLSLEYAQRLGELSVAARRRRPATARTRTLAVPGRYEERAVSMLVRAQFREDQKFRLGVLAILPITFFYIFMALRDRTLMDPFEGTAAGPVMIYYPVVLFPILLHANLTRSDSHAASWIFYTSPISHTRLVRALKNYIVSRVVLPYLAVLAAVFVWYFTAWWHIAVHVAVLLLFAHAMLLFVVSLDPALPFSRSMQQGQRTANTFLGVFVASIAASALMPLMIRWCYGSAAGLAILFVALLAGNAALDGVFRVRLGILERHAQFGG